MPDFKCPRCGSALRPEDAGTYRVPFNPAYDRYAQSILVWDCWCCTWGWEWRINDITEPEKAVLK